VVLIWVIPFLDWRGVYSNPFPQISKHSKNPENLGLDWVFSFSTEVPF